MQASVNRPLSMLIDFCANDAIYRIFCETSLQFGLSSVHRTDDVVYLLQDAVKNLNSLQTRTQRQVLEQFSCRDCKNKTSSSGDENGNNLPEKINFTDLERACIKVKLFPLFLVNNFLEN